MLLFTRVIKVSRRWYEVIAGMDASVACLLPEGPFKSFGGIVNLQFMSSIALLTWKALCQRDFGGERTRTMVKEAQVTKLHLAMFDSV